MNNFAVRSGCEIPAHNIKWIFIAVDLYDDALSNVPFT